MPIQNDKECKELIDKLDQGIPPQMIDELISYLEQTNNSEFTMTLIKYLNNQNIQSRNSLLALSSQISMLGEDITEIKKRLDV